MIKKNLLAILCIILMSFTQTFAQQDLSRFKISEKERIEIKEKMQSKYLANKDDKYNVAIPADWSDESVVYLEKRKINEFYVAKRSYLTWVTINHKVIKIQDKAAVEDFSTFYFSDNSNKSSFFTAVIKLVKPDGSSTLFDFGKDGIEWQNDNGKGTKIALPNLEVGDIIDMYDYSNLTFYYTVSRDEFPVDYAGMEIGKPILKWEFDILLGEHLYMNSKLHDLPEFKVSKLERDKISLVKYSLKMENINQSNLNVNWLYPYVELPNLQYQVFLSQKPGDHEHLANFGGTSKNNNSINKDRLVEFVQKRTGFLSLTPSELGVTKRFKNHLEVIGKDISKMSVEEIALEVYYFYRATYVGKKISKDDALGYLQRTDLEPGDGIYFARTMGYMLSKQNIDFDYVVVADKRVANINELVFEEDIALLLRVKTEERDLIFMSPRIYTVSEEIHEMYQNTDANVYNAVDWQLEEIKIPASKPSDNGSDEVIKVHFAENLTDINLSKETSLRGISKNYYQVKLANIFDVVDHNQKRYNFKAMEAKGKKSSQKEVGMEKEESKKIIDDAIEKNLLRMINSDYDSDLEKVKSFEVTNYGDFYETPNFSYNYEIQLPDFCQKVGPNYLLPVGNIIGGQLELEEDEIERDYNIYMPAPRSYSYDIEISIPEGYKVSGLEQLNMNVSNETGGFVSAATQEGNLIKLKVDKTYNNYSEPKENWSKMVEFLTAATDFKEVKILLEK